MIRFRAAVSNPLALIAILVALTLLPPLASPVSAFHFPWDQGHDTFSPTTPPDPGPCKGSNCNPCKSSSSPVYVPTGHFVWSDTDIVLRGRPYIGMTRTYNSNDPRAGLFGNGWSVGCDVGLYATTSGSEMHFVYRAPDGKRYEYVMQPDGTVTSPPGRFEQILPQPDGTVQILYLDNTRQVFRADGRLGATLDANSNRIDYSYDASDRLVGISDPNGRSLTLTYNVSGRVARVTDHGGRVWQYAYDPDGNLMTVTDPLGGVRRYEYAAFMADGGDVTYHQLTKITDASGVVVTQVVYSGERVASYTEAANRFSYAYNTATKTVTKTDQMNSRWTFVYNDEGLVARETDPLGNGITRVFDTNGRETSRIDQIGAVWSATYDTLGRTLSLTNPLAETTVLVYSGTNPAPVRVTSPSGRVTETTYDSRFNPLTVKDSAGQATSLQWDATGNLVLSADALGQQTAFTHNPHGLLVTATDPLLRVSRWSYDSLGRSVTTQNPAGEVSKTTYDVLDRRVQTSDPLGSTTSYSYDAVGRLKSLTDAKGNTTSFDHDSFGRLVTTTDPDGRIKRTIYRVDNVINQITLPDLRVIGYSYDAAKRVTREDAAGEVTTFGYNNRGELIDANGPGGSVSFTHDTAGRLIKELSNGQSVQSSFSNEGERTTLTAFGATTSYSREIRGLITSIGTPVGSVGLAYDGLARRTQLSLPNAAGTGYGYDAGGQLVSITHTGLFATTYDYTFDAAGRILSQTGDGPDWQYSYDAAGRLVAANHGAAHFVYSYDGVGNVLGDGRAHDSANRLNDDIAFNYEYDLLGNLTRKQRKTTGAHTDYSWNAKSQLVKVERFADAVATIPDKNVVFAYDPVGRRVAKIEDGMVERYVYDGSNLIAVLDGSGMVLRTFIFGPGTDQPLIKQMATQGEVFQSNHLGSIVAGTVIGGVTAEYHYDPYGDTTVSGSDSNSFRFTAREQDAADLYYYRARYYDPTIGRFISEDPVRFFDGANAYVYARNSPTNFTDAYGLWAGVDDLLFAGGGAVVGLLGQGAADLVSGHLSGWERYVAAAGGGAVGGEALLYTGNPFVAGGVGGFATNGLGQGLERLSGKRSCFSLRALAADTAIGTATGVIPGLGRLWPGVTSGRASYAAVYKMLSTKLASRQIEGISARSAWKMLVGSFLGDGVIPGAGAAGAASAISGGLDECGCQ